MEFLLCIFDIGERASLVYTLFADATVASKYNEETSASVLEQLHLVEYVVAIEAIL
jgi:hypothetical protein